VLSAPGLQDHYQQMKQQLHRELIGRLDLTRLEGLGEADRRAQVEVAARRMLIDSEIRLTHDDEERLVTELIQDTFDLGPITPLLLDDQVSDVLVNTHRQVYVERLGRLELTPIQFRDDAQLRIIIDRIISRVGRRIDESSRSWTPVCRMARASTPSSRRPRSMDPSCPSVASAVRRCRSTTCWDWAPCLPPSRSS
jgi:pilus assembly protein CpaF